MWEFGTNRFKEGAGYVEMIDAVSYTHLDVYKRQVYVRLALHSPTKYLM